MVKRTILAMALAFSMTACASHGERAPASPTPEPTPYLSQDFMYPHVRFADLATKGARIKQLQAKWLLRIITNSYWQRYADGLWFEPGSTGYDVPIIAFYSEKPFLAEDAEYQVIGEPCGYVAFLGTDHPSELLPAPGGVSSSQCWYKDPLSVSKGRYDLPGPRPVPHWVPLAVRSLEAMADGKERSP